MNAHFKKRRMGIFRITVDREDKKLRFLPLKRAD